MVYTLIRKTQGNTISTKVKEALSFQQRLVGLMLRKSMDEDEALVFYHAPSIHTFFMRFPIDLIFLNKKNEVIRVCEALRPWRMVLCSASCLTIELPAHKTKEKCVKLGDILELIPAGS